VIEVMAVIEPSGAGEIELALCRARSGEEETRLTYEAGSRSLVLDTTRSSLSPDCPGGITRGTVTPNGDGLLRLHLFLDRSVLEVFAHGTVASARIYPTLDGADMVLRARGGEAHVHSLDVWQLVSIWT
jgi:beta-fructofuranosidase